MPFGSPVPIGSQIDSIMTEIRFGMTPGLSPGFDLPGVGLPHRRSKAAQVLTPQSGSLSATTDLITNDQFSACVKTIFRLLLISIGTRFPAGRWREGHDVTATRDRTVCEIALLAEDDSSLRLRFTTGRFGNAHSRMQACGSEPVIIGFTGPSGF